MSSTWCGTPVPLGRGELGGADVHAPVELHRVGVDHLAAQGVRQGEAQRRLAGRGRPDHRDDRTGRRPVAGHASSTPRGSRRRRARRGSSSSPRQSPPAARTAPASTCQAPGRRPSARAASAGSRPSRASGVRRRPGPRRPRRRTRAARGSSYPGAFSARQADPSPMHQQRRPGRAGEPATAGSAAHRRPAASAVDAAPAASRRHSRGGAGPAEQPRARPQAQRQQRRRPPAPAGRSADRGATVQVDAPGRRACRGRAARSAGRRAGADHHDHVRPGGQQPATAASQAARRSSSSRPRRHRPARARAAADAGRRRRRPGAPVHRIGRPRCVLRADPVNRALRTPYGHGRRQALDADRVRTCDNAGR